MRINVRAKPAAHEEKVVYIEPGVYEVSVTEPPAEGRANRAIVAVLAEYFEVNQSSVQIISGHTSRNKIVDIKR